MEPEIESDIEIQVPPGANIAFYLLKRANELQVPVHYTFKNRTFDGGGDTEIGQTLTIKPGISAEEAQALSAKAQEELSANMRYQTIQEIPRLTDTIAALVQAEKLPLAAKHVCTLMHASDFYDFKVRVAPLVRDLEKLGYTANAKPTEQAFTGLKEFYAKRDYAGAARIVIGAFLRDVSGQQKITVDDYDAARAIDDLARAPARQRA